ncbi:MAG: TlpA family protein disulfide reductase, partial [Saprospiraceae bacterium]|nr:TlpA family protein disulfide reductase [Saprospiraceae bacterium]
RGTVSGINEGMTVIRNINKDVTDTLAIAKIEFGQFKAEGFIPQGASCYPMQLAVNDLKGQISFSAIFPIEEKNISVHIDAPKATFSLYGSPNQIAASLFMQTFTELEQQFSSTPDTLSELKSRLKQQLKEEILGYHQQQSGTCTESFAHFIDFIFLSRNVLSPSEKEYFLRSLNLQSTGQSVWYHRLKALDQSVTEAVSPDFLVKDINGKEVSLKDYRGRYVLIDFWASWCGPCIEEMPHLKQLYDTYKPLGLEIIGISIDKSQANWKKVAQKLQIPWINTIDNVAFSSNVANQYEVREIPANFLISPNGKLLFSNKHEGALDIALQDIFKK